MDGADNVEIPDDILIKEWDDPIVAICREIYLEMMSRMNCDMQVEDRAILAPTLELVDEINRYMKSLNPTKAQTYFSSEKACPMENNNDILASVYTLELLNTIRCSRVPNHDLTLNVGTPVMLLRNIDHSAGLYNETRMVLTKHGKHILEAKSISEKM
ncbi:uncharacterized protein LOC107483389 [Arachis duranensis]|uniref:Uncharacterized protein LOC107483389 n=1 Tax=Arachis duranensis TaxID=130453 RepID=A0A6P4CZF3_ARADU|nr:uncharacterized protein LOC107483389 [Arachis duranensis]